MQFLDFYQSSYYWFVYFGLLIAVTFSSFVLARMFFGGDKALRNFLTTIYAVGVMVFYAHSVFIANYFQRRYRELDEAEKMSSNKSEEFHRYFDYVINDSGDVFIPIIVVFGMGMYVLFLFLIAKIYRTLKQ